jgi:S-adenosylmethionine-diacylgycerolhomoserine-N-methlytransferase
LSSVGAYYRWHARIYDCTRWAFLFGRAELIQSAAAAVAHPRRILEVGCGTGRNLVALARRFPAAELVGLDLSGDMLRQARRKLAPFGSRITFIHAAYHAPVSGGRPFDLIVCSYCLSMINPGSEQVLRHCLHDLDEGGRLAIVDFLDTPFAWFRRWMGINHVRLDGHLLTALGANAIDPAGAIIRNGYGGLWSWFICVAARPVVYRPFISAPYAQ